VNDLRIGHGFDLHRLVSGRKLKLGGIEIPFELGLEGHSDADVLLHAVADSMLGAAGLPDIGYHFTPSDPRYRDADSAALLREVRTLVEATGLTSVVNLDCTIIAEKPHLQEYLPAMKQKLAEILGVGEERIGIKATTMEGMGHIGRAESMAAIAVCLLAGDG
jgi:2-C-methyl-D-erythritol 2,4-cyclodiphosphate synthase